MHFSNCEINLSLNPVAVWCTGVEARKLKAVWSFVPIPSWLIRSWEFRPCSPLLRQGRPAGSHKGWPRPTAPLPPWVTEVTQRECPGLQVGSRVQPAWKTSSFHFGNETVPIKEPSWRGGGLWNEWPQGPGTLSGGKQLLSTTVSPSSWAQEPTINWAWCLPKTSCGQGDKGSETSLMRPSKGRQRHTEKMPSPGQKSHSLPGGSYVQARKVSHSRGC